MALAEVELDSVLTGKFTDTELAMVHRPITAAVILRLGRDERLHGQELLCQSLGVPNSLFRGHLGEVFESKTQVSLQMTDICCRGSDLRGTVAAVEHRLT